MSLAISKSGTLSCSSRQREVVAICWPGVRCSPACPPVTIPRELTKICKYQSTAASFALAGIRNRSEEHTSELQSLMRISYAVFCLKKKKHTNLYKKQRRN